MMSFALIQASNSLTSSAIFIAYFIADSPLKDETTNKPFFNVILTLDNNGIALLSVQKWLPIVKASNNDCLLNTNVIIVYFS